jgi:RNA polymerase sigma-70 factor (ECF subfamily)
VHDVFVLLPRVVHRLEPGRSLRSFLMGILANKAKHAARKAQRQRRLLDRFSREPREVGVEPEAALSEHRLAKALERALDRVSMNQRIAFVLCAVEGRDTLEVAEILGIPEATVRTRLYYARQKLKKLLAKEGFG